MVSKFFSLLGKSHSAEKKSSYRWNNILGVYFKNGLRWIKTFFSSNFFAFFLAVREPQIYIVVKPFRAEDISLLSGRLVWFSNQPANKTVPISIYRVHEWKTLETVTLFETLRCLTISVFVDNFLSQELIISKYTTVSIFWRYATGLFSGNIIWSKRTP